MAAFLTRALDLASPSIPTNTFGDDDGSIFETDIETIFARGITSGCTQTEFCPSDFVTREQMAAFLTRALDLASPSIPTNTFGDDDQSIFETDIEAIFARGITTGCTQTEFCPSDPVTREQMAAFLTRALTLPSE